MLCLYDFVEMSCVVVLKTYRADVTDGCMKDKQERKFEINKKKIFE